MRSLILLLIAALSIDAATLISKDTGNWTTAGTWAPVSAVASAALDSEAGSTATTTSYVYSSTFTPAATAMDAIAIKIASRSGSPTGTFSVVFANNTTPGTRECTVTVNVSDIHASAANAWHVFKCASTVTPNGTDVYKVGVLSSTASQVTVYRDATAGNWSRLIRLTSAASAPAAGDQLIVAGEFTGAGTSNSYTVTMNETNYATVYGAASMVQSVSVTDKATLAYGTTAATAYRLKVAGIVQVNAGGTFTMGDPDGTSIPSDSTGYLGFSAATNVDGGLVVKNGATWKASTAASNKASTLLTANAAAGATSLTVGDTTGWETTDTVCIASTTRTNTEAECRAISTIGGSTSITVSALTNAHSGTSPTQAEVINTTRRIKIEGTSAALGAYVYMDATATVKLRNVQFSFMGSATATKRGVEAATTTGSMDVQYCAFTDASTASTSAQMFSFLGTSGQTTSTAIYSNNVIWLSSIVVPLAASSTSGSYTITDVTYISSVNATLAISDWSGVNQRFTAAGSTLSFNDSNVSVNNCIGTASDFTGHSSSGSGVSIAQTCGGSITGTIKAWRNGTAGVVSSTLYGTVTVSNITSFGNAQTSLQLQGANSLIVNSCSMGSDATFTEPYAVNNQAWMGMVTLNNCSMDSPAVHTNTLIGVSNNNVPGMHGGNITVVNGSFSISAIAMQNAMSPATGAATFLNFNNVAGDNRQYQAYGVVRSDTTIYNAASPAIRLTPSSASNKMHSSLSGYGWTAAAASGTAITYSVRVRKSVVGDGAAYNGNQPRLIVRANYAAGITSDTVLATASGAAGSWETLSGTTATVSSDAVLEFYVDADGTAGWENLDTLSSTPSVDVKGTKFWRQYGPYGTTDAGSGGTRSYSFVQ